MWSVIFEFVSQWFGPHLSYHDIRVVDSYHFDHSYNFDYEYASGNTVLLPLRRNNFIHLKTVLQHQ